MSSDSIFLCSRAVIARAVKIVAVIIMVDKIRLYSNSLTAIRRGYNRCLYMLNYMMNGLLADPLQSTQSVSFI